MTKVLVTGGAGFIGSHIVDELVNLGHDVVVYDNLSTGLKDHINSKAEFVQADIRDKAKLFRSMKNIDYVFHLAGQVGVAQSIENPEETFEINVEGTKNVISAAKENKVKKIIFSSSASVYGDNPNLPLDEEAELKPISPYAESKIQVENILTDSGMPHVSLRYFNVFGPRQKWDSDYAPVVPIFFSLASENKDMTIFGDGEQTRDFIHVIDVVKANILAMSKGYGVYNICSEEGVSVNEIASLIITKLNSESKSQHIKARDGEIKHSKGDSSKARMQLGFDISLDIQKGLDLFLK